MQLLQVVSAIVPRDFDEILLQYWRLNRLSSKAPVSGLGDMFCRDTGSARNTARRRLPMSSTPQKISPLREAQPMELLTEVTIHLTSFDQKDYRQLIEARGASIK